MNLRQVGQFLAVAETLNFRKAAERLHMAQPPLSVSIKRMEEDLGSALFLRQRRGLRLTAAGEAILAHARQIAFHSEELRKAAADAADGIGGVLRVGFIGSATYRLFPRVLPAFRTRYPRVTLDLRERTTREILREIEAGVLDVGLVRYPVIEDTSADLLPVEHDQLVAVMPSGSRLATRRRLQLKDLEHEPFVAYAGTAALNLRAQVLSACQAAGFTPAIAQEAVQVQTILSLVESGLGVALVPSSCQSQASRSLVFRALTGSGDRLAVAIAVATHPTTEPPAARRFRELLVELEHDSKPGQPAIPPP
ncbi:MAG TPA: LysR family transcriptional regulator [Ramlibacter sp.]|uniref:LysR family transcriptional regulator n=1 Tax=Ramlibacter sp. TaxID=1917967 RepID=UPI002BC68FF5|nr:LysR family transcriptional regulator [Ramlibacter sp.]HVZ45235.1 LysR family transcriptional regulator [Ramlibacter sp.]